MILLFTTCTLAHSVLDYGLCPVYICHMTITEQTGHKLITAEATRRRRVNGRLHGLPIYHPFIPIEFFDEILESNDFQPLEGAIYCGREGQVNEQVGPRTWLTFTWYKMDTGRYEIVAYVHG